MGKVFFSVAMSLDGFIAPEGMDLGLSVTEVEWSETRGRPAHVDDPDHKDWLSQWMQLQQWAFQQKFFRENLGLGEGGETGRDNQMLEETFARTGVSIMGKRMFAGGEPHWPEEAPFHTPVFVLTHEERQPWERPGGTVFYFVNDGIHSALRRAQEASGDRDIRIAGGADAILQYLNAGLVDEFTITLAPVVFGGGTRLFDGIDRKAVHLEINETIPTSMVTHLRYVVEAA